MRRHSLTFTLLAFLMLSSAGCYTVRYSIPPEHTRSDYDIIGSFNTSKKASWVIFGLVPLNEADVEQIVEREVQRLEGDAATNVVVTAQYDAVDVLVGIVLGGIFNTRNYTVTGDIVRHRGGVGAAPGAEYLGESARPIIGPITYQAASASQVE